MIKIRWENANQIDYWGTLLKKWHRPRGLQKYYSALVIILLFTVITAMVYYIGGVKYVYAHMIYVPILLSALMFGVPGGIIGGIIGGLLLGPQMPLDIITGEMQKNINWLIRMGFLTFIGILFGISTQILIQLLNRSVWMVYHNKDTKLPNLYALQNKIDSLLKESDKALACITIHISNYEEIISTYGSSFYQQLLTKIADRLTSALHGNELFAFHEKKFSIVKQELENLESTIKNHISTMEKSFWLDLIPVYIDVHVGVAYYPDHAVNTDTLIKKADIAALIAQRKGTEYCIYDQSHDWTNEETIELLGNVLDGLSKNQFVLYYQPKIDIINNKLIGAEALIRWKHPEKGLIPPYKFISQIENSNLIQPVTRWVIDTALCQLNEWRKNDISLKVSVNVSIRNLNEPDFMDFLQKSLQIHEVNPKDFEIEITESSIMDNPENVIPVLQEISALGINLSIDDFGTGYSSLAYLKDLPVNSIKIDQVFIRSLGKSTKDQAIVESSIDLAHKLGLHVVAEGVENKEALDILKNMKCNFVQGYYISEPLPNKDFNMWLHP